MPGIPGGMRAGQRPRRPRLTADSATPEGSRRPGQCELTWIHRPAAGPPAEAPLRTAAARKRTWRKEPPLFTAARETKRFSGFTGVWFSGNSLSPPRPAAELPWPPFGTLAPGPAQPPLARRSARGEGLSGRDPPASHQLAVRGEPYCSLITPGRTRRPWPLERSVFNGARWTRKASDPARGATSIAAASRGVRQPLRHRTARSPQPTALRSGRATALRPPGHLGGEKRAPRCPASAPRPPVPTGRRRSPHPSQAASPSEADPGQLRASPAAAPPAVPAAGAERGLPAPPAAGEEPGGGRSLR